MLTWRATLRRHSLSAGLLLMFALTWPLDLARAGVLPFQLPFALNLFVGWGFVFGALVMTGLTLGAPAVVALLRRYLIWRVSWRWYLVAFLLYPAIFLSAVTLDALRHLGLFLPNYWKNRALFRFHVGRPLWRDLGRLWAASERRRHPFTHDRDVEPPPNPDKVRRGLAEFLRLFPAVQGLAIERSWAGYIDVTPDAVPVLGPVASPRGLIVATGFSGHYMNQFGSLEDMLAGRDYLVERAADAGIK